MRKARHANIDHSALEGQRIVHYCGVILGAAVIVE
jgi:uncharacterized protein YbjQ (UPF0145 family)